jgi:hypothetical protein
MAGHPSAPELSKMRESSHIYSPQWCLLPVSSNIFAMDQTHTIVGQRAAKIVLLLLAGLSVLSFAVAGVAVFEHPTHNSPRVRSPAGISLSKTSAPAALGPALSLRAQDFLQPTAIVL